MPFYHRHQSETRQRLRVPSHIVGNRSEGFWHCSLITEVKNPEMTAWGLQQNGRRLTDTHFQFNCLWIRRLCFGWYSTDIWSSGSNDIYSILALVMALRKLKHSCKCSIPHKYAFVWYLSTLSTTKHERVHTCWDTLYAKMCQLVRFYMSWTASAILNGVDIISIKTSRIGWEQILAPKDEIYGQKYTVFI